MCQQQLTQPLPEFLLFLCAKAIRGDLWYWIPLHGALGAFVSFFCRLFAKLLTDWSAVVQFRHPSDIGGAYFSFSLVLTVLIGLYASASYSPDAGEAGAEGKLGKVTVLVLMGIACAGILVSYATLLLSMKKEYRYTFFSMKTGRKQTQEIFTANDDHERKFKILSKNTKLWKKEIGEEVKSWIGKNLPIWMEEQPEWFTAQKMSVIGDEMVGDPGMLVRLKTGNLKGIVDGRRRSSLVEDIIEAFDPGNKGDT